jgi:hypothetical protein
MAVVLNPLVCSIFPMDDVIIPLPTELSTPPVMKMNFIVGSPSDNKPLTTAYLI